MIPLLLCAVGFVTVVTAFFPIAVADWLPRSIQLLVGSWSLIAGLILVELRGAVRQDRVADEWRYGERDELEKAA